MNRRAAAVAGVLAAGLALAACTPPLPTPQPDAEPAVVQPALSSDQIDRVLDAVNGTLQSADTALSAEALDVRVTGPAKTTRAVQYQLAAAQAGTVTAIPAAAQTIIDPATDTWPRTVMVITEPPEDLRAPLLLTLVQNSPREQFKLWSWVRLFPGVQMPATAQPSLGSAPVAPDADTLAVPAVDVMAQYADILTNGTASPYAASFVADDPLRGAIAATRTGYASLLTEKGSLTETYQSLDTSPYAIATADGGAIVVGSLQTVTTITLADSTLSPTNPAAALLGKPTVSSNLAITWLSMVAFAVPPAGSTDPIQVLGAEHSAIQVTGE